MEPMEFEWMIFPGFTKLQILHEIQKIMETFGMSTRTIPGKDYLHVDVQRHHMGRSQKRTSMSHQFALVAEYAKKVSLGHWSFLGPGSETKWNATDTFKPGGEWSCRAHEG